MDAPGAEPRLRHGEAASLGTEQVADRHPRVLEQDLAVALPVVVTEDRQVPNDRDAGCVRRDEHHRLLGVSGCLGIGLAHHNQQLAAVRRRP
jgi:hypothetical protein